MSKCENKTSCHFFSIRRLLRLTIKLRINCVAGKKYEKICSISPNNLKWNDGTSNKKRKKTTTELNSLPWRNAGKDEQKKLDNTFHWNVHGHWVFAWQSVANKTKIVPFHTIQCDKGRKRLSREDFLRRSKRSSFITPLCAACYALSRLLRLWVKHPSLNVGFFFTLFVLFNSNAHT